MSFPALERGSTPVAAPAPHPVTGAPVLTFAGLHHSFGRTPVLNGVSLSLADGELLSLVGPSGCGKTTLLRLICGLERVQEGEIRLRDRLLAAPGRHVPPEARDIGLVFQDYALFPHLSALGNAAFGLRRMSGSAKRTRALEVLEMVGLADHAAKHPHQLSGGQQQRLALARAIAPRPHVLLLDEPFSNLDPQLRRGVQDEVLHLVKATGIAAILVTHDPDEAMALSDRVCLMRAGRIVQVGTPAALYAHPVDGFAAAFFGEVNRLCGRVEAEGLTTPLGRMAAPGLRLGQQMEILLRPEHLRLEPAQPQPLGAGGQWPAALGRVIAVRRQAATALVHVAVEPPGRAPLHLHVRLLGVSPPAEGAAVGVTAALDRAILFPADDCDRSSSGSGVSAANGLAAPVRSPTSL